MSLPASDRDDCARQEAKRAAGTRPRWHILRTAHCRILILCVVGAILVLIVLRRAYLPYTYRPRRLHELIQMVGDATSPDEELKAFWRINTWGMRFPGTMVRTDYMVRIYDKKGIGLDMTSLSEQQKAISVLIEWPGGYTMRHVLIAPENVEQLLGN